MLRANKTVQRPPRSIPRPHSAPRTPFTPTCTVYRARRASRRERLHNTSISVGGICNLAHQASASLSHHGAVTGTPAARSADGSMQAAVWALGEAAPVATLRCSAASAARRKAMLVASCIYDDRCRAKVSAHRRPLVAFRSCREVRSREIREDVVLHQNDHADRSRRVVARARSRAVLHGMGQCLLNERRPPIIAVKASRRGVDDPR